MNKHQEVWQIIKRLDDAKDYIEKAMTTDLNHAKEEDILLAQQTVEELFFILEKVVWKKSV